MEGNRKTAPNHALRNARLVRRWTQRYVAGKLDIPDPLLISDWERGVHVPGLENQRKLCEFFELSAEELGFVAASDPPSPAQPLPPVPPPSKSPPPSPSLPPPTEHRWGRILSSLRKRAVISVVVAIVLVVVSAIGGFTLVSSRNQQACRWMPTVNARKPSSLIIVIQLMLISHQQPGTNAPYNLGHYGADGVAGPATQQAIKEFQRNNHLNPTGVVDTLTWEKLIRPSEQGDSGEQVIALQARLNAYYLSLHALDPSLQQELSVDGDYGPITEQAVEDFQSAEHLEKTGKADMNTWCALVGGEVH